MGSGLALTRQDGVSLAANVLGWSLFLTTLLAFMLLASIDGNWESWPQATCLSSPSGCFCERPRNHTLVRQPANTFSNLAFTVTGVLVLIEAIEQRLVQMKRNDQLGELFAVLFGLSNVILGAGSGWYHASLTFQGQWLDNAAMYLLASAPLLYAVGSIRIENGMPTDKVKQYFLGEYFTMNAMLGWLCLYYPPSRRYIFLVLIVALILMELRARRSIVGRSERCSAKYLVSATALFIVAFVIWIGDLQGIICNRDSLLQGHAAWHLLTGAASFQLFLYYHGWAFGNRFGKRFAHTQMSSPQLCTFV